MTLPRAAESRSGWPSRFVHRSFLKLTRILRPGRAPHNRRLLGYAHSLFDSRGRRSLACPMGLAVGAGARVPALNWSSSWRKPPNVTLAASPCGLGPRAVHLRLE